MEGRIIVSEFDDDLGFREQGLGAAVGAERPRVEIDRDTVCQEIARVRTADLEHRAVSRDIDDRAESTSEADTQRILKGALRAVRADEEPFVRTAMPW